MKKTLLALVAVLALCFTASAADISGKWAPDPAAAQGGGGGRGRGGGGGTYEFKVSGDTLTGSVTQMGRNGETKLDIADGKVTGDTFTFSITRPGFNGGDPMKVTYTGKVNGDKIELSFETGRGPRTVNLVKAP